MGGKTTKLFKGSTQQGSKARDNIDGLQSGDQQQFDNCSNQQSNAVGEGVKSSTSPFVHYRRGSMYIDEDGDVAHEFYVETKEGSKVTLKQISNKYLTPQGDVPLEVPCLRNDYPVILLDQSRVKE